MKLQLVVVSKKLDIFALLFFSYAWALKRDYDRLEEVSKRVDVNPLGRLVLTWLWKEAWEGGNWQEGGLEGGNCVGGRSDTYFIVLLSEYKLKGIGLNSSWCYKSSSTGKYILWACHKTHPYLWVMRAFIKNNMINRQLTNQLTNWVWPKDWWIDWQNITGCVTDLQMTICFPDWLIHCLSDWQSDLLSERLFGWPTDWLTDRLTTCMTAWLIGWISTCLAALLPF